ncbi:hypothetical protein C3L33_17646, partial [Rhododendron williamsianum]
MKTSNMLLQCSSVHPQTIILSRSINEDVSSGILVLLPPLVRQLVSIGVLKKVKKLELKGTQKNEINSERIPALEEILLDVYAVCHPKPIDYFNRKDLVRVFNAMAKEIYGNSDDIPVVEEFGSFLMDIFSPKSDLDLSVNFTKKEGDFPQEKKIQSLRKFAKKLYALRSQVNALPIFEVREVDTWLIANFYLSGLGKGHLSSVQPILSANVPILKIVDRGTGIECDISIENRDGILKSQIVRMISSIDGRFQKLCFLMKAWAKAHGINSSRDRTLNSLSIISLVAFHLQTRDPPILPPFSAIFEDGIDSAAVGKMINNLLDFGKMNKESLGELFITLLVKVEDFTDRSLNVARVVGKKQFGEDRLWKVGEDKMSIHLDQISTVVSRGRQHESMHLDQIQRKAVQSVVVWRGPPVEGWGEEHESIHLDQIQQKPVPSTAVRKGPPVKGWGGEHESIHLDQTPQKAVQSTVVWRGTPVEGWGEKHVSVEGWGEKHVSVHFGRVKSKGKQSIVVWGGTPVEGWGPKHVSTQLDQIQPKGLQATEGWGGIQQATLPEPIRSNGTQSADGWGQWGGDNASCSSTKHLSVPAQKRIGIRKSSRQDPNTRRRLRSNGYRNL